MKLILSILALLTLATNAVAAYPTSESCNECHENIYREHTKSMHHKSTIFENEVHRKVKNAVDKDKYKCAICHMPGAQNLRALMNGTEQPNHKKHRQADGVSCFFCHQISKIYNSDAHKINFSNYQGEKKPTVFGNLKKPYESNEHNSQSNEIYKNSEVCMGCHSHKQNAKKFEVCNTKNEYDKTSDCIGCHMPKTSGTIEKEDKGIRDEYASHEFLGVHSAEMIKKAVKLELSYKDGVIELTIDNRMGHAIITHPMRLKFAKTVVTRDGKIIWSNFKETPLEDKEATFIIVFKDDQGNAAMPHEAIGYKLNRNLKASQSKTVHYKVEGLKHGDEITTTWISYIVNPKIAKKLDITTKDIIKPYQGIEESIYVY
ncbi:MAG: multiheme c-type cytochrome [Campylobacterota bacterium]|nr:multiheme c-type cytochrome [Campylobacterota bacterium]